MLMPRTIEALPTVKQLAWGRSSATVTLNGQPVTVEWSRAAARALVERSRPLVLELELLFSCLVKKTVSFSDAVREGRPVTVTGDLQLCFRAVTATACTMELAERLGRQPVTAIDTPAAHKLAPRRVWLDRVRGAWQAEFWL